MDLTTLLLSLPLALDGESVSGKSTAVGVISLVSIIVGYVGLAALWYFVFRDKARRKRKNGSPD